MLDNVRIIEAVNIAFPHTEQMNNWPKDAREEFMRLRYYVTGLLTGQSISQPQSIEQGKEDINTK